jgi:putative PIN family toxin of toxin-antitoxin system
VVVDTNIWISAMLSRDGAPARMVKAVLARALPVFSAATFAELETRLWQAKFDRYLGLELRRRILHDLNGAAHWVELPAGIAAQRYCRDADDDKFIHVALAAGAAWLITGDRDLLDVPPLPELRILTTSDALQLALFAAGSA